MSAPARTISPKLRRGLEYKWVALANTTVGTLMATINSTIIMISLPVIFRGLHVNPLAPGQTSLLLWILMGYNLATTVLLVTFGRISDNHGKVRFYNLGFIVFTLGSLLATLTPSLGLAGEWELIAFRAIQGVGGAFLFATSAAILTDAFPSDQRGLALGINQIAAIGGSVLGLVLGGVLAAVDWRLVFLISVPIGIAGSIWSYLKLREVGVTVRQPADAWGNVTFGLGLTLLMVALTYSLLPYGKQAMGWGSPVVEIGGALGVALLLIFLVVERKVAYPMFQLRLFAIRSFAAGNLSGFLAALARGGLQFMLIIWLQGVWLPLHGVAFSQTPLQAGIDTLPMMVGFMVAGPLSGSLSDRYGARIFSTAGMLVSAFGFWLLTTLPADFAFGPFALYLGILGVGMGLFAAPNTASIMNAVPAAYRGVASGMRATFQNGAMMMSLALFFTMVISGLSSRLPGSLLTGLTQVGLSPAVAGPLSHMPPVVALFSALLGYNPLAHLLPAAILNALPKAAVTHLLGTRFFASLMAGPFSASVHVVFDISAVMSVVAALASLMRGGHFVWQEEGQGDSLPMVATAAAGLKTASERPEAQGEQGMA